MKKIITIIITLISLLFISSCRNKIENKNVKSENPLCRVNLFTSIGEYEKNFLLMNLGHAFVTFENLTNCPLQIGNYNLEVDEEISISIWPISGHFSIWYNLESKMINISNKYSDRISISFEIDQIILDKINQFLNTNPKWGILSNCSKFVLCIYNIILEDDYTSLFITPKTLYEIFKHYDFMKQKIIKENSNIGYFDEGRYVKCELEY